MAVTASGTGLLVLPQRLKRPAGFHPLCPVSAISPFSETLVEVFHPTCSHQHNRLVHPPQVITLASHTVTVSFMPSTFHRLLLSPPDVHSGLGWGLF